MSNIVEYNLNKQVHTWQKNHLYPLIPPLINNNKLKTVIFLRGISGTGKTTISNALSQLLGSENVVSYSADNYFTINGVYNFDIKRAPDAHKYCVNSMEIALQSPTIRYIIMDNTHTQLWHLYNAENIANKYCANLYYIDITVPDKAHFLLCLKRQRHNVPEDVLLYQWNNWEDHPKSKNIPMFVSDEEMSILSTITDNTNAS
jgi:tRNA uridine 5-carbamoylmethylation protein Kti12